MPSAEAQRKAGNPTEGRKPNGRPEAQQKAGSPTEGRSQTESGNILTYRSAAG